MSTAKCLLCEQKNRRDTYSSSSLQTHPVFTQHLACARQRAVWSWPTCSSFWAREHKTFSTKRKRVLKIVTTICSLINSYPFLLQFNLAFLFFFQPFLSNQSSFTTLLQLYQSATLALSTYSDCLSSLPPHVLLLSWLRSERKTLLYQSQTSGDWDPLICSYSLCCCSSSSAPHQPWLQRWINPGIVTDTYTCMTGWTR